MAFRLASLAFVLAPAVTAQQQGTEAARLDARSFRPQGLCSEQFVDFAKLRELEIWGAVRRSVAGPLFGPLEKSGKDWLMGGGESLRAFAAADLVDRWELAVLPITLGQGVPLFPRHGAGSSRLRLVDSRALANGVVTLTYERAAH